MFEALHGFETEVGKRINAAWFADEAALIRDLADGAAVDAAARAAIEAVALDLIDVMRRERARKSGLDAFLHQYDLSSEEGVVLMCLAEALLRIPDPATMDALIADRLAAGDWGRHLGVSDSLFVNASTWGLMLTGRMVDVDVRGVEDSVGFVRGLVARLGEPVVRQAMLQAVQIMAQQFVMGPDIGAALQRSADEQDGRYRYSFDMLGEAALTRDDARRYSEAYGEAICTIGKRAADMVGVPVSPLGRDGISIKLSALSPRFEVAQLARVRRELVPRLTELVAQARRLDVPVTIDAEESDRLELTLAVFEAVQTGGVVAGWEGLGVAVQAYQRRSPAVIDWLTDLSAQTGRRIPVRLVKGAYWDTEIKRAQAAGLSSFPVFTRKTHTDVAYLAGAKALLGSAGLVPQFATHNAHTVAWVLHHAPAGAEFEFQRLHGMGRELYDLLLDAAQRPVPCRVYAPVGAHEHLLPYLVRRLLENGANTSFVNRIVDADVPAASLAVDPVAAALADDCTGNPAIAAPADIFAPTRRNSAGLNLADGTQLDMLGRDMAAGLAQSEPARPVIDGQMRTGDRHEVRCPADTRVFIGSVEYAGVADVDDAIASAAAGFSAWNRTPVADRALILERAADLIEVHRAELAALCTAEGGRCVADALAEIREAVDFLRYYAEQACRLMAKETLLPGVTGERNTLHLAGRGVFVCISPWNFPAAIFTGQVAAALVTGNTVVAKPAEQTSLIAARLVALLYEAGIPADALQFVPGSGAGVGARAVADARVAGVVFTGSTATARSINRTLAARDGALATLIAETGGLNAMIVDSTALLERMIVDVMNSAFNSAGQRCSALRLLCLQDAIADRGIELLRGRMAELGIGRPDDPATDVGPVIDARACRALHRYRSSVSRAGRLIFESSASKMPTDGYFFPPLAVEISAPGHVRHEVFGPILHVVRYRRDELDALIDSINASGYGLTFGIQSRIESRIRRVSGLVDAGNVYVNRDMVGAVVGAQPFGGRGLSGTGPKAGGPHYLQRFVTEKTISVNTSAIGGDARLLGQSGS